MSRDFYDPCCKCKEDSVLTDFSAYMDKVLKLARLTYAGAICVTSVAASYKHGTDVAVAAQICVDESIYQNMEF